MNIVKIASLLTFTGLLLSACAVFPQSPNPSQSVPETPSPSNTPVLPAVTAAQAYLAAQMQVTIGQVTVVKVEAKDWPDGCLGAARPDEICTEVVTPGYQILLQVRDKTYTFRTNKDGSIIRPEPVAAGIPIKDLPVAVQKAQAALAKMLGVMIDAIQVVSFEAVNWADGCLGVMQKGVMCIDMVTPGYRVILATNNAQYEYHTDQTGQGVVMAKSSTP